MDLSHFNMKLMIDFHVWILSYGPSRPRIDIPNTVSLKIKVGKIGQAK